MASIQGHTFRNVLDTCVLTLRQERSASMSGRTVTLEQRPLGLA